VKQLDGRRIANVSTSETVELVAARLRVCPAPPADGATCLRLEGTLDGDSALPLARVLLDAQRNGDELVLDMSRLAMVDVAGLRVLVDAARRAVRERCDLVLRAPSPAARALFRVTGLGHWNALDDQGCVYATLPPRHRAVLAGFGRPGLI
jgi:anti-anti-sigma factor